MISIHRSAHADSTQPSSADTLLGWVRQRVFILAHRPAYTLPFSACAACCGSNRWPVLTSAQAMWSSFAQPHSGPPC
jgi:hypothetical protein